MAAQYIKKIVTIILTYPIYNIDFNLVIFLRFFSIFCDYLQHSSHILSYKHQCLKTFFRQSRNTPWCTQPQFLRWCGQMWFGLQVFVPGSHWLCSASLRGLWCRAPAAPSPLPPVWSDGSAHPSWSTGPQYLMGTKRFTKPEPHWSGLSSYTSGIRRVTAQGLTTSVAR